MLSYVHLSITDLIMFILNLILGGVMEKLVHTSSLGLPKGMFYFANGIILTKVIGLFPVRDSQKVTWVSAVGP